MMIDENYKKAIYKALNKNDEIKQNLDTIMAKNINNIFLVGCGGSLAIMYPIQYILDITSLMPSFIINAGEFNSLKPKKLNNNSLVILISSSGSTPEVLEAAKLSKKLGAYTIGISVKEEPKLSKEVDYSYNTFIESDGINEFKLVILYQLIFYLLDRLSDFNLYPKIIESLNSLPDNLLSIKKQVEEKSINFARKYRNEKIFYTIGSGNCWGIAYSFAVCKLEEMQWLIAQPIHAGEFFHGPFEVIDEKSNLLIFKGEDTTRPLVDRVINFSKKYNNKVEIFDTKDYILKNVPNEIRGYFSPFILIVVTNTLAKYLAEERNHPLSTRRYMGKVQY